MTDELASNYVPLREPVPVTEQIWPEGTMPLVCTTTMAYMHEKFIGQCIEGLLRQRTTFPVEFIIHDDASPDATADIIRDYQGRYPQLLKVIYQQENIHRKSDRYELLAPLREMIRSKYRALCEGDDYWTDPLKLQKQVAILEADQSLAASAHNVLFTDEQNWGNEPIPFATGPTRLLKLEDVAPRRSFHTASLLFRRDAYDKKAAEWLRRGYPSGDKVLNLTLHLAGDIHYSEEIMAVYRRHTGGASTSPDLDRFMHSDTALYRAIAAEFSGSERTYILDCANYYRIEALLFKIRNRGTPKLVLDYIALIPLVGRSRFLPWQKFKLLGKELYFMFRSICNIQLRKYLPGTKTASKR